MGEFLRHTEGNTREAPETYVDLHLSVEAIVEQQVVGHADSVGLHGMPLTVIVVSNIAWNAKDIKKDYMRVGIYNEQQIYCILFFFAEQTEMFWNANVQVVPGISAVITTTQLRPLA